MAAHHHYYAPDFCPAFWDCVLRHFHTGRLLSIDKVRDEVISPEALVKWTKDAPDGLFVSTAEQPVTDAYRNVMAWVNGNAQFRLEAREKFSREADGWLVAYAQAHAAIVVTDEKLEPDAKKRVPLPNVCRQFNVRCLNTFEMLRQLGVQFDLSPTQ